MWKSVNFNIDIRNDVDSRYDTFNYEETRKERPLLVHKNKKSHYTSGRWNNWGNNKSIAAVTPKTHLVKIQNDEYENKGWEIKTTESVKNLVSKNLTLGNFDKKVWMLLKMYQLNKKRNKPSK